MVSPKPIYTVVLDAAPMLKNDPPISSLLAKSDRLVTVPTVISEIKDATARSRLENIWMPFLETISPSAQCVKAVTDFARKTGDLVVLSRPDLHILALTYEVESQRNGLSNIRTVPAQKLSKPKSLAIQGNEADQPKPTVDSNQAFEQNPPADTIDSNPTDKTEEATDDEKPNVVFDELSKGTHLLQIVDAPPDETDPPQNFYSANNAEPTLQSHDSDSQGWITPANIQKHQARHQNSAIPLSTDEPLDVACITSDFAMQNVLLSMNLGLLNTSLQRVRNIKTFILRCHACFGTTKDMTKQFCPRCGKPTLTRVSCSTNSKGEFKLHLKKNMQWNHRGDRYSIPKPVPGSANGKINQGKGGGKGGWGQNLILAEDQKEYLRATSGNGRKKERDLMDEDYLPSILTGERGRAGGRPKVGAGRNVNSKKR
ncbi:MAG: hypothetical protein Q9166_005965 [cf. Caloplaca sp. 2 TL-2023]